MRRRQVAVLILSPALYPLAGCAHRAPVDQPGAVIAPAESREAEPAPLPPVPSVTGPIAVRVVYPGEGQLVQARDSNFVFGSVGTGGVRLRINGATVPVLPNGAFLAFLPVPPMDNPVYQMEVARGRDTLRVAHRIALPPSRPKLGDDDELAVDVASLQPSPRVAQEWSRADRIRVSVRAPRNARVALRFASGAEALLYNTTAVFDSLPNVAAVRDGAGDPLLWSADVPAAAFGDAPATVVVRRGADSIMVPGPRVTVPRDSAPRYVVLGTAPSTLPDTDRVIIGRPVAGGTYKWFLLPGTIVEETAHVGNAVRIRLDTGLEVWVDASEAQPLSAGTVTPRRVAANARVVAGATGEWSDVVIPMTERPPYAIEEGDRSIELTMYGTQANTDIVNLASADRSVARVVWEQVTGDRARYVIQLRHAPYGYLVRWERGAFVLRVRRPPAIDPERPLAGLRIAVDAGHPPAGATGPTGLYEPVATLAIAQRVQSLLEARGATVVMTRTAPGALGLADRPVIARRANAHAFVSIHLNALPDGVNPFVSHGTGTYYFNPHSVDLAREVQRGMVRRIGLEDLGTNYDNLAVLRPAWMPAVLCEGAFIMIPEQEAALRTPEFQHRYALGVVEGLEAYFERLGTTDRE